MQSYEAMTMHYLSLYRAQHISDLLEFCLNFTGEIEMGKRGWREKREAECFSVPKARNEKNLVVQHFHQHSQF